jgi:hypothetical protein
MTSPRPSDILVTACVVGTSRFEGSCPPILTSLSSYRRRLNRRDIRRQLRAAPRLQRDTLIDLIFDESWSVRGGNDTVGLRHELVLLALEHLGASRRSKLSARVATFDTPSVFEMPTTRLTWRGLKFAEQVLLRGSAGGSSILGPSIRRAEESAPHHQDLDRLLVVLSDFELFDPSPEASMQRVIDSSADQVLAISLNNEPPYMLAESRVRTARVLASDSPADLANHVIDAARACAEETNRRNLR